MGEPTEEMHDYMQSLTGADPRAYALTAAPISGAQPAPGAPPGSPSPMSFSPLTPQPAPNLLDPKLLQPILDAEAWLHDYLATNKIATVPNDPASPPAQIMFGGKPTPMDKAVATTVAAGRLANLPSGDQGRAAMTDSLVRSVIAEMLNPSASADADADGKDAPKKDGDDALDTSVETTNQHVDTQIQVTIKLRGEPDDKRMVVVLPDVEVTLHVGKDASASSIEAQLNLIKIKKDVSDRMRVNGHVIVQSINFKAGVSGEAGLSDAALLQIQKSLEVKLKAELEFKITDHISISLQAEEGKNGPQIGPALTYHF